MSREGTKNAKKELKMTFPASRPSPLRATIPTGKTLDDIVALREFLRHMTPKQMDEFAQLVTCQLQLTGENPKREGLLRTPQRVAKSMGFLTSGYALDPMKVLNEALFDAVSDEMVIVKDIDFYSLCEHHMLPFFGKCHIAYIPRKKVIGLSKLPRLVDVFARRLQIQERMTYEIATTVKKLINAQGVGVVIEGQHLCMMMRGVEKQNSYAVTSTMLGTFRTDSRTRSEFLELLRHKRNGF
jgi:GTP cyclohydrolase I